MKVKVFVITLAVIALALAETLYFFIRESKKVDESRVMIPTPEQEEKRDKIIVTAPLPDSIITSPLAFEGKARGSWYFEASFPVFVVNWDGRIVGQGIATAQEEWMTTEFVPFRGIVEFETPEIIDEFSKRGALIFKKDNPSGLPEHDDALEIPIRFQ